MKLRMKPGLVALLALWTISAGAGAAAPVPENAKALLDSAQMWDAKNRADLARLALEKVLLIDPNNPQALYELGMIEIRSAQLKRAAELLAQLQQAHPDDPATRSLDDAYRIATSDRMLMATARFLSSSRATKAEAVKAIRALFPKGPPNGDLGIEYYQILAGIDQGRAEAKAGLERMIRESPGDPRPRLGLADFYNDQPETRKKGIQLASELARRDDLKREEVQKVWRRGLHKLDLDPDDDPLYRQFLAVFPDDGEIQQRLKEASDPLLKARHFALKKLAAGQTRVAEQTFLKLLKTYPDDVESLEAMGKIRLGQDRIDEAKRYFAAAAKRDPSRAGKWDERLRTASFWSHLRSAKASLDAGKLADAERAALAAIRLNPKALEARLTLSSIYLARPAYDQARAGYLYVLKQDPSNARAVSGVLSACRGSGDRRGALRFLDDLAASRPALAASLSAERASLLRDESDELLSAGKTRDALGLLEHAVKTVPDDPWLRYDLARLYRQLGFANSGRELMERAPNAPSDPQANYTQGLYLAGIDDEEGALTALQRTPERLRNESMRRLEHDSWFRLRLKQARAEAAKGRATEAEKLLSEAEHSSENDVDRLWTVASAWIAMGKPNHGLAIAKRLQSLPAPENSAAPRIRYADLLNDTERDEELGQLLASLPTIPPLGKADAALLKAIRRSYTVRRAETLREIGATGDARTLLQTARQSDPDDPKLLRALAELDLAGGQLEPADRIYQALLARDPLDFDARLSRIKIARLRGDTDQARQDLARLRNSVAPDDTDTHLGIARQLTGLDDYDAAREELTLIRQRQPDDPKVLLQAGRVEKYSGHYKEALALLHQAELAAARGPEVRTPSLSSAKGPALSPAAGEIQSIERRRYGYVSAGYDFRELSGTPGISAVTNQEYPMLFRYPIGYTGHVFAQVDYATVTAGALKLYDFERLHQFGKVDALGTPPYSGTQDQSANGAAFALGYQSDDWRFDVGSSPQGYPVSYPVGGIRHSGKWGAVYYSWDLARRPAANSLLSYAGARDPITNEVWGGVRADGGDLYMGYDYGRFGAFAQGGAHYFSGENVRSNNDIMLRGGADWSFIQEPDMRLTAGFALMYWRYAHNERFYTFGYGGYFSPQDYKSVALPVQWVGRWGDLAYLLRAYGAYSLSDESGGVYYPTDRNLQALAQARAGTEVDGFVFPEPFHDRSVGNAVSYGIRGAFEYQVDEHWFLGGLMELQRSPFYTPNYMTFYFRYALEPRTELIPYPPQALRPYYRY